MTAPHPCIVLGVTERQPPQVIRQAAGFARRFGATLVCAHVDADAYVVAEHPDGSVESRPIDPDLPEWDNAVFDRGLADRIKKLAGEEQVLVELRELAGDIGHALGRLAEALRADQLLPPSGQLTAGTGLLGGYTTFSTASYETVRLLEERRTLAATVNAFGMLLAGTALAALGFIAGRALT